MAYHNILSEDELLALLSTEELEACSISEEKEKLEANPASDLAFNPALNVMQVVNTVSELQEVVARLSMRVKHLERQLQFQKQERWVPKDEGTSISPSSPSDEAPPAAVLPTAAAPLSNQEQSLISRAERHRTQGISFFKK